MILSKSSCEITNNFCSELGNTAKKIHAQRNVPHKYRTFTCVSAYLPCKNPHLRSISVGKFLRRIIRKFRVLTIKEEYFISWIFAGMCRLDA